MTLDHGLENRNRLVVRVWWRGREEEAVAPPSRNAETPRAATLRTAASPFAGAAAVRGTICAAGVGTIGPPPIHPIMQQGESAASGNVTEEGGQWPEKAPQYDFGNPS